MNCMVKSAESCRFRAGCGTTSLHRCTTPYTAPCRSAPHCAATPEHARTHASIHAITHYAMRTVPFQFPLSMPPSACLQSNQVTDMLQLYVYIYICVCIESYWQRKRHRNHVQLAGQTASQNGIAVLGGDQFPLSLVINTHTSFSSLQTSGRKVMNQE